MKSFRPTSKSRRHMTVLPFKESLTASEPYKPLTHGFKRDVGRNAHGRITVRHQGGGHKRRLRTVDFKFDKKDIPAKIETIASFFIMRLDMTLTGLWQFNNPLVGGSWRLIF